MRKQNTSISVAMLVIMLTFCTVCMLKVQHLNDMIAAYEECESNLRVASDILEARYRILQQEHFELMTEHADLRELTDSLLAEKDVEPPDGVYSYQVTASQQSDASDSGWHELYAVKITAYCPCSLCCGKWANGITASGVTAQEGRTVAVDPSVIPLGSEVEINGAIYIAEDTGVYGNAIDLFMNSHQEALQWGIQYLDVRWRKPID